MLALAVGKLDSADKVPLKTKAEERPKSSTLWMALASWISYNVPLGNLIWLIILVPCYKILFCKN